MRIAIDARMGDTSGGIGVYIRELISQLVDIDKKNQYFVIVNKHGDGSFAPSADNFTILVSSITRKHYFIKDLWNLFFLPFLLKANNIDIYFNPRYVLPIFKGKTKMVVTMHDMIAFLYPEIWPGISGFRIRSYIKYSSQRADIIITISSWVKKDIIRILNVPKDKVKVIYEASNLGMYPKVNEDKGNSDILKKYLIQKPYFLYVGEKRPHKNLEGLIKAFAIYKEKYDSRNSSLVLTGKKYFTYHEYITTAKNLGVKDSLIFTGFIPEKYLKTIYSEAEALLLISFYEGFGIPILEAMECGVPVITSNISSMPEVAGEAALLVDPNNIQEIAEAMNNIVSSKTLRKQLIESGLKRVKQFSWERTARQTLKVYNEIYRK